MAEKQNIPEIRFEGFTDPWEQRKLGSIAASFDYGLNAAATDYDGQNKYLRITDIDDITHEFLKSNLTTPLADLAMSSDYLLEEGNLLFARTGASVGKTYLYRQYDGTVYFAGFLIRARIGESADPEFVYQATLTDAYKKYVAITSQRSGQPGVNAQEYADYQLMLPSRMEQQQIGRTLRSLDNLITLHQRKYDKLCTVKKSMLDKMFPKPGETEPEIRFEGFTDPWEQRKLGELCAFSKGHGYSKANIRDVGTPLILYGRLYTQYESRIEDVDTFTVEQDGSLLSKGNEVIVPASGETAEDIAVASSVRRSGIILGGDLNVITPVCNLDPDYTALAITYSKAHDDLAKRAQGKSVVHIHGNDIAEVEISYPSESEQRCISSIVLDLDSLITLHQRKFELLRNIKKSLLDRMFV